MCYAACAQTSSQWLWVLGEDDKQGMCDFCALIIARKATGLHVVFTELNQRIRVVRVLLSIGGIRGPAAQVPNLHTNKLCHCFEEAILRSVSSKIKGVHCMTEAHKPLLENSYGPCTSLCVRDGL